MPVHAQPLGHEARFLVLAGAVPGSVPEISCSVRQNGLCLSGSKDPALAYPDLHDTSGTATVVPGLLTMPKVDLVDMVDLATSALPRMEEVAPSALAMVIDREVAPKSTIVSSSCCSTRSICDECRGMNFSF